MLPKTRRLTKLEVPKVLRQGRGVTGSLVRLTFLPLPPTSQNKFAVVVSKKVAPQAVDRNLIRRRAYDAIARVPHPVSEVAVVLLFLPSTRKKIPSYKAIERDVRALMSRVHETTLRRGRI